MEHPLAEAPTRLANVVERPLARAGADVLLLLLCTDAVALAVAAILVGPGSVVALVYGVGSLVVLVAGREYRHRLSLSVLEAAPRLVSRLALPLVAVSVTGMAFGAVPSAVLVQAPLSVAAVLCGRAITTRFIRRQRCHGRLVHPTVIVGAGSMGVKLSRVLSQYPEYGLRPVGIVDDVVPIDAPVPLLGPIANLRSMLSAHGVAHVIMAFSPKREEELVKVVRSTVLDEVEVYVVPRFFDVGLAPRGPDVESVGGIPLHRIRGSALRARSFPAKRMFDVVVSGLSLLVLSPLLAAIAVVVRLGSPGPVLFRQPRVGQDGRTIEMLKFRTLPHGYVDRKLNADSHEYSAIGWFLRRTSLDELPQLINVLRGDMTLVGPRPERGYLVEQFNHEVTGYEDRHRLPMGLTGLAQVHGLRGDSSIEERARFDNYYIENWSLWQDLIILIRTFGTVIRFGPDRKPTDAKRAAPVPSRPLPRVRPASPTTAARLHPARKGTPVAVAAGVHHSEPAR